MATRSRIGRQNPDGTVTSIYCHWDGYPSHHGPLLVNHYTDPAKVDALIALGAISCLAAEVAPPEGIAHTFKEPVENVVIAYGRDRSEKNTEATTHDLAGLDQEEYAYLFRDGVWLLLVDGKYEPLADHLND